MIHLIIAELMGEKEKDPYSIPFPQENKLGEGHVGRLEISENKNDSMMFAD